MFTLEGFNEGIIIKYQKDSNLMRREATTSIIRGNAELMAILDMLDKEVQTLIIGNSIVREIDMNVNTRKVITTSTRVIQNFCNQVCTPTLLLPTPMMQATRLPSGLIKKLSKAHLLASTPQWTLTLIISPSG